EVVLVLEHTLAEAEARPGPPAVVNVDVAGEPEGDSAEQEGGRGRDPLEAAARPGQGAEDRRQEVLDALPAPVEPGVDLDEPANRGQEGQAQDRPEHDLRSLVRVLDGALP